MIDHRCGAHPLSGSRLRLLLVLLHVFAPRENDILVHTDGLLLVVVG